MFANYPDGVGKKDADACPRLSRGRPGREIESGGNYIEAEVVRAFVQPDG